MQRGDVLLQSRALNRRGCRWQQVDVQAQIGGRPSGLDRQIRERIANRQLRRIQCGLVTGANPERLVLALDAAVAHPFIAQRGANVTTGGFKFLSQRGVHVDLQHKVHAATQIQTQIHGRAAKAAEPIGGTWHQVQGDHVTGVGWIGIEGLLHHVARLQLRVSGVEPNFHGVTVKLNAVGGQARLLQRQLHTNHGIVVHPHRCFAGRDLHGRRLSKEIR